MAHSSYTELEEDCTVVHSSNLILVCVDACDHSLRAFHWYLHYFHQPQHQVALVHVYTRPEMSNTVYTPDMYTAVYNELLEEELRKSAAITEKFLNICKEKGLKAETHSVAKVDNIGHTICSYAKEKHAANVVLGQRGLGAVKRTVFGSVSEHVLHHAHIPVLIVPPPKGHKHGRTASEIFSGQSC